MTDWIRDNWLGTLKIASAIYIFISMTYLGYLGMVRLYIAKKKNPHKLTKSVYIFAGPALVIFLLSDVLLNLIMSIPFLQLPQFDKLLFTARLSHNVNHGRGYRKKLARYFCSELLDKFDFGQKHCDKWDGE